MTRIKMTKNFHLDEFVDPYTYLFESDNGLSKLDERLFKLAQKIRELYGKPLTINNWWVHYVRLKQEGKNDLNIANALLANNSIRRWSGLRTLKSNIGAKNGAHYRGLAIDLAGDGDELYDIVKNNAKELYDLGLRRIEDKSIAKTWLHADTWEKNTVKKSIRVVDKVKSTETIYF